MCGAMWFREGAARIKKDMLLNVGPADVRKRYAKKMPHSSEVYDGSAKEIGPGYMACQVMATEAEGAKSAPLVFAATYFVAAALDPP